MTKPSKTELSILMGWHALVSGAFIVAAVTDDDAYAVHEFAGLTIFFLLGLRVIIAMIARDGSPLQLPGVKPPKGAPPGVVVKRLIHGALGASMLIVLLGAVLSGYVSEDLHEGLGGLAIGLVVVHLAVVFALHGLKVLTTQQAR